MSLSSSIRLRPTARSFVARTRNPPVSFATADSVSRNSCADRRSTRSRRPAGAGAPAAEASPPVVVSPCRVERVDDRSGARGRVDDRAQVAGLLVARAHPDEEAVRDQEADLAAGERGQAAQDVVELGEGDLGEAQLLGQDPAGLPLGLLRSGPVARVDDARGAEPARPFQRRLRALGREDAAGLVLHQARRELQRVRVAAQDELGLHSGHLRAAGRSDVRLPEDEAIDRPAEGGAVASELLDPSRPAGRDDGDPVVGAEELGHESMQGLLRVVQVAGRDVEVVHEDRHVPPRPAGRFRRGGRGRRRRHRGRGGFGSGRRGGRRGAAPVHDEELRQRLGLPVLEELEVLALQVANELAVRVGDDDVEPDQLGPNPGRRLLGRRRRPAGHRQEDRGDSRGDRQPAPHGRDATPHRQARVHDPVHSPSDPTRVDAPYRSDQRRGPRAGAAPPPIEARSSAAACRAAVGVGAASTWRYACAAPASSPVACRARPRFSQAS